MLISYIEAVDETMPEIARDAASQTQNAQGTTNLGASASISRSKKNRLVSVSLQLLHELVLASTLTRTALLDHGIPALLL